MTTSSTGPKTDAGKFIASKNSLTHGLTASGIARFPESIRESYCRFLVEQYEEWQPVSENEKVFLERYAFNQFQLLRAQSLGAQALEDLLAAPKDPLAQKHYALMSRHLRALERSAKEALLELRTLIADRMMALETDVALQQQAPGLATPLVFPHHLLNRKQARLRTPQDNALRFAYHLSDEAEPSLKSSTSNANGS